jgi:hypothetical protein
MPLSGRSNQMKYLIAWGLGVPGVLVFAWLLMNRC